MVKVNMENTHGGVAFRKAFADTVVTWMQIHIRSCLFVNNTKFGSGGAIAVISHFPLAEIYSKINFENSKFLENKAVRLGHTNSYGGALSIKTEVLLLFYNIWLHVNIDHCEFTNNQAEDGGGSIYTSKLHNTLNVNNSIFTVNNAAFISPKALFIQAHSSIKIKDSIFIFKTQASTDSLLTLEMMSDNTHIGELDLTVDCLPWHRLSTINDYTTSPATGTTVLQKYISHCSACSVSFYLSTKGIFLVLYLPNTTDITVTDENSGSSEINCLDCPYGADCPGDNLKPKPNYWGYKFEGGLLFQQCPTGYCCTGSNSSPCSIYNVCSGNRAGTLCGGAERVILYLYCLKNVLSIVSVVPHGFGLSPYSS